MGSRAVAGVIAAVLAAGPIGAPARAWAGPSGTKANAATATQTFSITDCATVVDARHGKDCGPNLAKKISALQPGDTLNISPGTYVVGSMQISTKPATATNRITIQGSNFSSHPILVGWSLIDRSDYLTLSGIDFQAGLPGLGGLEALCGVGWTVQNSHIFGADSTAALYNMFVAGRQVGPPNPDQGGECTSGPRDFTIRNNYFTRPYTNAALTGVAATEYHNLYLGFEGNDNTGGVVEHNVFVGNHNGAGIKLQDGKYHTLGPWHVQINYNTFYSGQRGIFLLDDVRYNSMVGNLIYDMSGGGGFAGTSVGVVTDALTGNTNTLSHTYVYKVAKVFGDVRDVAKAFQVQDLGDNRIGADPKFVTFALVPTNPDAKRYGAYSTTIF